MTDPLRPILDGIRQAEIQLANSTKLLNEESAKRDQEILRAESLFKLFQERRFVDDIKNGRVCQPPIFYEEWNNNIGKITNFIQGANDVALPQMMNSYKQTIDARINDHNKKLSEML